MRKLSSMAAAKAARRASESRARRDLKTYWRENGFEKMRLSGIVYEPHQISNIPIQTIHDLLHAESAQRAGENTRARKNKPMEDIRALVSDEIRAKFKQIIYANQPDVIRNDASEIAQEYIPLSHIRGGVKGEVI